MKKRPRGTSVLLLLALLGAAIFFVVRSFPAPVEGAFYSEVAGHFERGEVEYFMLDVGNGNLEYRLRQEEPETDEAGDKGQDSSGSAAASASVSAQSEQAAPPAAQTGGDEALITYKMPYIGLFLDNVQHYVEIYQQEHPGEDMEYTFKASGDNSAWLYIIPYIILLLLLGGIFYYFMFVQNDGGAKGAMNVGKAKVKNQADAQKNKTTFRDVAGADEEKEELQEIVEFLKNPKKFNSLGARIPHGVLLVGPPGTGKTLLARACAGEAGVPFYSISGSDFVEMYVGVGASRVRDLFDKAKKTAPGIVFIDEIDAVGRQRGAGLGGGHDEREQTLNQLLVEMDGFGGNEGVIVVAATNRADILDKALLRPGRFDRQVYVGLPDVKGREEILQVHTKAKPLAPDVDLRIIARTTPGFTGADLENLVNEAALLAARRGRKAITEVDIEEASIKVMAGPEKKSKVVTEKERRLTAYHEAGHAIAAYYCPTSDPVHQITIIPHGPAGGFTMYRPEEDVQFRTRTQMRENLISMLGGRVAEHLVLDDISTGASNDLERVTQLARAMVTRYGFSEKLGPVVYDEDPGQTFLGRDYGHTRSYSENVASEIDHEVRSLIDTAFHNTTQILKEHLDQLHLVAATLLEREKISGEDFRTLMTGGELPPFVLPDPRQNSGEGAPAGPPAADEEEGAVLPSASPAGDGASPPDGPKPSGEAPPEDHNPEKAAMDKEDGAQGGN